MAFASIQVGDKGDNVRQLQTALRNAGYNLQVDGVFGEETNGVVKRYQRDNGFDNDGIVSENIWNTLTGQKSDTSTETGKTTADALAELIKQFQESAASSYTPKLEDELRNQAKNEYQSYYDQLRLAAQQQQERNDLSLAQQRDAVQKTYDKQRETTQKQYDNAYSQTDRQMLSRGMQRSSYGAQTLANLANEGAKAQQDISDAQGQAEANIDAQRQQLAQQLSGQLSQYDTSQAADILKRYQELQDTEYNRQQTADSNRNNLLAKIYEYTRQQEQDALSKEQWEKQFNAQYPSSNNSSYTYTPPKNDAGDDKGDDKYNSGWTYEDWLNALGGGNKNTTTVRPGQSILKKPSAK